FSERTGSLTGHFIPISGSSQRIPDSALLLYTPVVRYWISAKSESTQNPRANPAGAHISSLFCSLISIPNQSPRVGEPLRISTAARKAEPNVTRISLPMGGSHWKCNPLRTFFCERE